MKSLPRGSLRTLAKQLAPGELRLDAPALEAHAGDKWFAMHLPEAVALPGTTAAVSKVLRFAHQHRVPVTARGAGHGYVGGCVPVRGGIVLSLARMNRIIEINAADFVAVAQAGVVTQTLQDAIEKKGLYYPPDPASRADSTLGGNIASNAGGPRCLKYGVTREYVLGLEAVLADGTVARVGGRTHKNKAGFDLTRLFVGSEGLLGVVTEATLKLLPLPPYRACLAVGFASTRQATRAIGAVFAKGFLPSALEIADAFTLAAASKRTGSRLLGQCGGHLIVELDGQKRSVLSELRGLERALRAARPLFLQRGYGPQGTERIWQVRREFSYALRDTGLTKLNEDVVVPRGRLEELFRFAERLQKTHSFPVACFGHAGDGNIHVNIMVDPSQPKTQSRLETALDELFSFVLRIGGTITGEHGIGIAKQRWWPLAASTEVRALHRAIKQALDPLGILNPGKFV
jgi:glycolate dehydrogenase FAD-linked subunit